MVDEKRGILNVIPERNILLGAVSTLLPVRKSFSESTYFALMYEYVVNNNSKPFAPGEYWIP